MNIPGGAIPPGGMRGGIPGGIPGGIWNPGGAIPGGIPGGILNGGLGGGPLGGGPDAGDLGGIRAKIKNKQIISFHYESLFMIYKVEYFLPEPDCITGGGPLSCVTTGGGGSLSVLFPLISS